MKIKEGFIMRNVGGENIVVAIGNASENFHGMIKLNETAAFLWKKMEKGISAQNDLVTALTSEYDVNEEQAEEGVSSFLQVLKENQILE